MNAGRFVAPLPINADYSSDLNICLGGRELAVRACSGLVG